MSPIIDRPCILCGDNHPEVPKRHVQRLGAVCDYCHGFVKQAEKLLFDSQLRPMTAHELRDYRTRK